MLDAGCRQARRRDEIAKAKPNTVVLRRSHSSKLYFRHSLKSGGSENVRTRKGGGSSGRPYASAPMHARTFLNLQP